MSILNNEGHDPNGLGNRPGLGSVERAYNDGYAAARAKIERLLAALDGIHTRAIDLPDAQTRARNAIVGNQQGRDSHDR
jgi:hypothetical protein